MKDKVENCLCNSALRLTWTSGKKQDRINALQGLPELNAHEPYQQFAEQ